MQIKRTHLSQLWLSAVLAIGVAPHGLRADGFHNAAVMAKSLEDWQKQLGASAPSVAEALKQGTKGPTAGSARTGSLDDLMRKPSGTPAQSPPRSGRLQGDPVQQAAEGRILNDCLEILAFMDPKNIIPTEFPQFKMQMVPKYRDSALAILQRLGPQAVAAVAERLRTELMTMPGPRGDMTLRADFHDELIKLLRNGVIENQLTDDDAKRLREAAEGQKAGPQAKLAGRVLEVLEEADLRRLSLKELMAAARTNDPKRRTLIENILGNKLREATLAEAVDINKQAFGSALQFLARKAVEERLASASILELLTALEQSTADSALRRTLQATLDARSPAYRDVKDELRGIAKFTTSSDQQVRDTAQAQITNAFTRAPIGDCLAWAASGDATLTPLLWTEVDAKIARADADRRASYREAALEVVKNKSASAAEQSAACDLLVRLKDPESVAPLVDATLFMSREMWPKAGETLRKITGQDFGPRPGGGAAELSSAVKQWRQWLQDRKP